MIEYLSFFSDNPNLVSYAPVTVQVLDVNDNAPYIATDSALVVCEGSKAGQVSYLISYPHSSFSPTLFLHHLCFLKPSFFHILILYFFSHICMNTHTPTYTNAMDTCINEKHICCLYDMSDTINDGFISGLTDFGGS